MRRLTAIALAALLAGGIAAAPALAQGPQIGQVKSVSGEAVVVRGGARLPLKAGDPVYQRRHRRDRGRRMLGITFNDNSVFSTGPGSQLSLDDFRFDPSKTGNGMLANLRKGTLTVVSGGLPTPTGRDENQNTDGDTGVRGTTFAVEVR